jgi:sugar phosphate permease
MSTPPTRSAAAVPPHPPHPPSQCRRPAAKPTRYRWVVMGLIFLIWAIACADRANFGIALPYMKKEYGISNTEAGLIVSLFSFAYGFVQIPVGLMYKRLSEKTTGILFSVFMLLTSLFTGLMGTTSSVLLLQLYRVGLGLSEGPLGIGCTNVINRWFPPEEKGTATGLWIAASKLGPLIVPTVCIIVIQLWGWREILRLCRAGHFPGHPVDVPGDQFAGRQPFLQRGRTPLHQPGRPPLLPRQAASPVGAQVTPMPWLDGINRTRRVPRLETLRQVFTSWNVIGVALGYGCMIGIANIFMSWMPTYLVTVKGFASVKMGFLASAPFIGAVAGNMLGGVISDRLWAAAASP